MLDFLRDTANPWLQLFRRLPLQIGPLDLSPIVAIIALQIVGAAHHRHRSAGEPGAHRRSRPPPSPWA